MISAQTPLRIAQVIGRFGGGGAQRAAINLALGLQEIGCASTAIALKQAGDYADRLNGRVPVIALKADRSRLARPVALLRLRRILQRGKYDLLWVHGAGCLVPCALAMTGQRRGTQLWFTWHDSESVLASSGWSAAMMRWALGRCDRLFGSSRSVAENLQAALAERAVRTVEAFPNGVPVCQASQSVGETVPTILWAARLVPTKDPQILVRAAAKLKEEGLKFRIILAGDALPAHRWYAEQTRALISEMGLTDRIAMPGWVDDMPGLCRQAAIGVQTSHSEGLSMTLLEQMMAGLAVVATEVGDTAVAVEHEKTGLLIPAGHEAALIDALRRLIQNVAMRCCLADAARHQAMQQFSLTAVAQHAVDRVQPKGYSSNLQAVSAT